MLGDRVEGIKLDEQQIPAGKPYDIFQRQRKRFLQRLQQETAESLFTASGFALQLLRRFRLSAAHYALR